MKMSPKWGMYCNYRVKPEVMTRYYELRKTSLGVPYVSATSYSIPPANSPYLKLTLNRHTLEVIECVTVKS